MVDILVIPENPETEVFIAQLDLLGMSPVEYVKSLNQKGGNYQKHFEKAKARYILVSEIKKIKKY